MGTIAAVAREVSVVEDEVHTGPPAVETGDEPPTPRRVAPGGWRRALIAFALGALAGAAAALVAPRDEGPRRTLEGRG